MLTLRYCVKDAYATKRQLIITAIDFKKAYDSVKREQLVKAMIDFKINEKIIDVVSEIYSEDMVVLTKGTEVKEEITATSGIRQGCTLSTTLFKLITFKIIEGIDRKVRGYSTGKITLRTLFYADDGLLFSTTLKGAKEDIQVMENECRKYGLEINREKSNIMIYNRKEKPEKIGDIQVVREIKYLGVWIRDEKDLFRTHKKYKMEELERLTNMTYGIIKKACNRLLIGKTYLKSVVIPNILYGSAILDWERKEERTLQIKQNEICRKLMNAPKFCAIPALKGEIGLSDMKTRLIQSRLQYINNIIKGDNKLLKRVLEGLEEVDKDWYARLEEYRRLTGIQETFNISNPEIKKKCREMDTKQWEKDLNEKKTLEGYRDQKKEIKEENIYHNDRKSDLWFRARTNCMDLNDKQWNDSKVCVMCGHETENLEHFIIHCNETGDIRKEIPILQRPARQEDRETLRMFLYVNEDLDSKKEVLMNMWRKRETAIKESQ